MPTRADRLAAIRDRLGPFARPHRHLRTALAASVVVTAAQLALPWPLTWLVDLASGDGAGPAATAGLPNIGGPAWPVVALVAVGLLLGGSGTSSRRPGTSSARSATPVSASSSTRQEPGAEWHVPRAGRPPAAPRWRRLQLRVGLKSVLVHVLQLRRFLLRVSKNRC